MGQFLLLVVVALTVGAVIFGVTVLLTGGDRGLSPAEPDGRAVPLPVTRPLVESDIARVRFDTATRGYRMAQVDQAMRRAAYDIGYKDELINVLEAEVDALRSGRFSDAEVLRRAREAAQATTSADGDKVDRELADREKVGGEKPAPAVGGADVTTIELGVAAATAAPPEHAADLRPADETAAELRGAAEGVDDLAAADKNAGEAAGESTALDEAERPADGVAATLGEPAADRMEAADRTEKAVSDDGDAAGVTSGGGDEGTTDPHSPVPDEGDAPIGEDDAGDGSDAPETDSVVPSRR